MSQRHHVAATVGTFLRRAMLVSSWAMRAVGAWLVCGSLVLAPVLVRAEVPALNGVPPALGGTVSGSATDTDTDTDSSTDTATDTDGTATDTDTDTDTDTSTDTATDTDTPTTATDTDATSGNTTGTPDTTESSASATASTTAGTDSSSATGDFDDDDFIGPVDGCDGDLDDSDPGCCDSEESNSDNFLCAVGARSDRVILLVVLVLLGRPRKRKQRVR